MLWLSEQAKKTDELFVLLVVEIIIVNTRLNDKYQVFLYSCVVI